MSKKNAVLAKAEEIARSFGISQSQVDSVKAQLASIWGEGATEAPAPAAPETRTFNVQVGVEVLASVGARQSDIEQAVRTALESAAARRDEVVSVSVAGL